MTLGLNSSVTFGGSTVDFSTPIKQPPGWFEDFTDVRIGKSDTVPADYSTVATSSRFLITGTAAAYAGVTIATSESTGAIKLTQTAGVTDGIFIQPIQFVASPTAATTTTPFTRGAQLRAQCRLKTGSITTNNVFFGMCEAAGANPSTGTINGFGFQIVAGTVQVYVKNATGSVVNQATTAPAIVINTYYTLEIQWDGLGVVSFLVNGIVVGTYAVQANIPTGLYLAPCVGHAKSAGAGLNVLTVDTLAWGVDLPLAGRV